MTAFEVFRLNSAVVRHFEDRSYDFFKYRGTINVKRADFEKRKDVRHLLKISQMREPHKFIFGNAIYGSAKWIGEYEKQHQEIYEKSLKSGLYMFRQQLSLLRSQLFSNFVVDIDNTIPYTISLYLQHQLTMHSMCVFQTLFDCDRKWQSEASYPLFKIASRKIYRAAPFFSIDKAKYKAVIIEHFNL